MRTSPLELVELLKGHKVFIQGHNFPDPDAIGSAFGLQKFLEKYDVTSTICYVGDIDRISTKKMMSNFGITLENYEDIKHTMSEEDYVVNVDCQKPNANTTDIIGCEVACIDHHPVFIETDEYKYMDIQITGACASIIASYYDETETELDKDVAAALAYAIKMDTDNLIRGTTELDMKMMTYLFSRADWDKVSNMYNFAVEYADLTAYGAVIENIEVYEHMGFSYVPFECTNALVAILCDFILSLDVVDVAVIYSVNTDGIKFSVRSVRPDIHAGKLIESVLKGIGSGGGHAVMAGGFVPNGKLNEFGNEYDAVIKKLFIDEMKK